MMEIMKMMCHAFYLVSDGNVIEQDKSEFMYVLNSLYSNDFQLEDSC